MRIHFLVIVGILFAMAAKSEDKVIPVEIVGINESGVSVTSPSTSDLSVPEIARLKPLIVVVENHTEKTVVAYTLSWNLRFENGKEATRLEQYKFPSAVFGAEISTAPGGKQLHPGEKRLVSMHFEVRSWAGEPKYKTWLDAVARDQASSLDSVVRVRVELDGVIFDDGTLLGRDTSDLASHFAKYVQAKQDSFLEIIRQVEGGKSVGEAFDSARTAMSQTDAHPESEDLAAFSERIYRRLAAEELSDLRIVRGDKTSYETIRRSVRDSAFQAHRPPARNH